VVGSPSIKDGLAVLLWRVVMPSPPQLNQDVLLAVVIGATPSTLCTESVSFLKGQVATLEPQLAEEGTYVLSTCAPGDAKLHLQTALSAPRGVFSTRCKRESSPTLRRRRSAAR